MKSFVRPLLALMSPAAVAGGTADMAASFLQMLLGLGLVLALLFGTLMLLRRLQQGQGAVVGGLKVLSAASVGPRERVVMVKAGSKILVLGVAPGCVNMLQSLEEHEVTIAPTPPTPPVAQDFAARLKQLLESRRREN